MTLPHRPEFRHGRELVFITATVAGAVAMLIPGDPIWLRMLSIPVTYLYVGASFGAGWLMAHLFRVVFGWLSPSFAIGVCLFYFYGMLFGAVALLLILPFDLERPSGQELRDMVLWLPASFGFAAGIRFVLAKHAYAE